MKTTYQKKWQLAGCLMVAALMLTGCGKKSGKAWFQKEYVAVQMSKGDSWSIIDKDGKEVVKEEYPADASISSVYDGVYWVKQGDTYQLYSIDSPKKPLTDEEFAHVTEFEAGVAAVSNPNQQIRLINTKGKTVVTLPKNIKRCYKFTQWGYTAFKNTEDKMGAIDTKGKIVVKPEYEELVVSADMIVALKDKSDKGKILILDMQGKKTGDFDMEKHPICTIWDGLIVAKSSDADDAHIAAFDKTGKKVFEVKKSDGNKASDFFDGYLTFSNSDGKMGVTDDKGEVLIRPKYDNLMSIGNGEFYAKKGDKWGVVNDKDETILDFDYDDWYFVMGDHYVMKDGSSWSIVGKDGKEVESFHACTWGAESHVEFVDGESLTNSAFKAIEDFETGKTAAQMAKELSMDIDQSHYRSYIEHQRTIDDKLIFTLTTWYNENIAEEKTHQEQVNDGWFTYTRTVSDGWSWSKSAPRKVSGTIKMSDSSVSVKDLYKQLVAKLSNGRKKVDESVFSKNIKLDGKTVECRTSLQQSGDDINLEILFQN